MDPVPVSPASRLSLCSIVLASMLLPCPRVARANGAFPEVSQLVADPADRSHLVLRSNFGLLVTYDTGKTWDLVCEAGAGYQNIQPPIAVLEDSSVIAGLIDGIAQGDSRACNFSAVPGVTGYIADVSRAPGGGGNAVAVSVDLNLNSSQVLAAQGGQPWAKLGTEIADLTALTLDAAADDANIVYVSGSSQSDDPSGVLARTADGGASWKRFSVPGTTKVTPPYIAAISATDHDTLYVRTSGTPGHLLVTHDGGAHFDKPLDFTGQMDGFALSPDGKYALAAGRVDGVWRAPTSTLAFERLSCAKMRCLSWSDAGLFACADEFEAGFIVGQSQDLGASFEPVLHLSCVRGVLDCPAQTTVGDTCPMAWPMIAESLGTDCASAGSFTPSTECRDAGAAMTDASAPDASTVADAGHETDAATTTDASMPDGAVTPIEPARSGGKSGCGCVMAERERPDFASLGLMTLGVCWARRHARRRESKRSRC